jgi:hypothetical protein
MHKILVTQTNGNVGITMSNEDGYLKIDFHQLPDTITKICIVENPNANLEMRTIRPYIKNEVMSVKIDENTKKVGLLLLPALEKSQEDEIIAMRPLPRVYLNDIIPTKEKTPILYIEAVEIN